MSAAVRLRSAFKSVDGASDGGPVSSFMGANRGCSAIGGNCQAPANLNSLHFLFYDISVINALFWDLTPLTRGPFRPVLVSSTYLLEIDQGASP